MGSHSQVLDPEKPKKKKKHDKPGKQPQPERENVVEVPTPPQPPLPETDPPETLNVKVEVIYDQPDRTLPIVGYFPSGYDPSGPVPEPSIKFYRNAQRVKADEKRKGSERMELVVNPNTESNVQFVGTSYRGEAAAAQLCTYALGVLDKENGSLKIMPVAGNKILRLEPKVHHPDAAKPSKEANVGLTKEEREDKLRELTRTFGTKKSQNQDKKRRALNVGNNPDSLEDLEKSIENVAVNKEALEGPAAHTPRNIPPHNSSATTPQEAYPLEKIIFTGEWDFLEDVYQKLQVGAELADDVYPAFVCNRMLKLKGIQDEVEQRKLSCIFSYITHLIKFKDTHSWEGASSVKNHRFPSILRQKFFGMFAPNSRRLPDDKRNLLISYVLVLTLYADDFRTNPIDIAKDLRMDLGDLRGYFENLGCKLVRDNKLLLATLPVPLKFPELRRKRRR